MIIARYRQQPFDRRRRNIDYTAFLAEAETISTVETIVSSETDPNFDVDTTTFEVVSATVDPDGKQVIYLAGGGLADNDYTITFQIVTSLGQKREDEVTFIVREDV